MTCTNVIMAQPEAGASVNYTLPEGDSAQLSFGPDQIDTIKLGDNGSLVISFANGGQISIENFESLVDGGNLLFLADGTIVDPKTLKNDLTLQAADNDNHITIDIPSDGVIREIMLEPGQQYVFEFNGEMPSAAMKQADGSLIMTFANGAKIVLSNYDEALAWDKAPELTLVTEDAQQDLLVSLDALIMNAGETAAVEKDEQPEEKTAQKSDVQDANTAEQAEEVAQTEPAAGEEEMTEEEMLAALADELAEVQPAAGEAARASNSGYGYNSKPVDVPLGSIDAVGPLGRTQLLYSAPQFKQETFIAEDAPAPLATDDTPVFGSPPSNALDETNLNGGPLFGSGTVLVNYGNDTPGAILPNAQVTVSGSLAGGNFTAGGVQIFITQTANGYIGEAGASLVFEFTIDPDTGAYTYTQYIAFDNADPNNPDDEITLQFGFTAVDSDGDSASSYVQVTVADDAPIAVNDGVTAIESGTITGNVTDNDTLSTDATNMVTAIEFNGNTFAVPSVGTVIVVGQYGTLTIAASGAYSYTAHANNPDGTDTFTYTLRDYDGDTSQADLAIMVSPIDDVPVIIDPGVKIVDETDLGPITVGGQLQADFGTDGNGGFAGDGSFSSGGSQLGGALTSGGVPVVVTFNATTGTYVGMAGAETIFDMTVNADGTYTFHLYGTLDHADPNDPNDIINLNFGVKATDLDGDVGTETITVLVKDDVPKIGNSAGDVDETNLDQGPLVYQDTVDTDFGQEIGSVQPGGSFTATANGNPIALMAGGVAVIVTQTASGYVGTAGGATVFTLDINSSTGQYTYTQHIPLDHPDTANHNDEINLSFSVDVVSNDGDTATGTISIAVADDGVNARNDINGAEEDQFITGDVMANDDVSTDLDNVVRDVTFDGTTYVVPEGGSVTITTALGTLIMNSDGTYSYQVTGEDPNGLEVFTYTLKDGDGDIDTATLNIQVTPDGEPVAVSARLAVDETNVTPGPMIYNGHLDVDYGQDGMGSGGINPNGGFSHSGSVANGNLTSGGVPVVVTATATGYIGMAGSVHVFTMTIQDNGDYSFQLFDRFDHADSTDPNDLMHLNFGVTITDADGDTANGTIVIDVYDDAPVAYDDWTSAEEDQVITGNLLSNDEMSEDRPNLVVEVKFNGATYGVPASGSLIINGDYGVFTVNALGQYTYTADHDNPDGTDTFTYVLQDHDGDRDTAELYVRVTPDGEPVAVSEFLEVDETNLNVGPVVYSNNMNPDFGMDGAGTISPNGTVVAGESMLGGALTHEGIPVVITATANGYVGMAGAQTIFTLSVQDNGDYTFTLFDTLDHADPTAPDDVIRLQFGFDIADADGDAVPGYVDIVINDDAPVAYDDFSGAEEDQFIAGNVTHNDDFSEDNANTVVKVTFEGTTYDVPATGVVTIVGQFGTFTMAQNGSWTYQATAEDPDGTEVFTYTLRDGDGDTDTAELAIRVTKDGEPVEVTGNNLVDETSLKHGPVSVGGQLQVDYGTDGVGEIRPSGSFQASGSLTSLTHKGVPVIVTQTADGYVGMAGSKTIFALDINTDGSYEFTLFDTLDHGNPYDPNDNIKLEFSFGVEIVDADGDTAQGFLTINVLDDAPVARDDKFVVVSNRPDDNPDIGDASSTVDESNFGSSLSVTDTVAHDFGNDGAGAITANGSFQVVGAGTLTSGGVAVVVTQTANGYVGKIGSTTIFTLSINASTGQYTYQQFKPIDHPNASNPDDAISLKFGVQITDADGDVDAGNITINVKDDGVEAHSDMKSAAEGQTVSGNVTGNDDLSADVANTVTKVTFNGTNYNVPASGQLTIVGTYGTLKISADGAYTYTAKSDLSVGGGDTFTYTLKDADGDSDTADLVVQVTAQDDQPIIVNAVNTVDETGGFDTVSGTVNVNYGGDAPGAVTGTGSFNSSYALKSNGVAVSVSLSGNTYTGTAGGQTIFTLKVNADGTYTFQQFKQLDHSNTSDANDQLSLNFGIKATDGDGDSANGTITIKVLDDGPAAVNDGTFRIVEMDARALNFSQGTTYLGDIYDNGSVLQNVTLTNGAYIWSDTGSDSGGFWFYLPVTQNDSSGADSAGFKIVSVEHVTGLPHNAEYQIAPDGKGILYRAGEDGNRSTETIQFKYTVVDGDGDKSTATFSVEVLDRNSPLVLDLDGDGIELLNSQSGVFFDMQTDGGIMDQTGWAGPDDGFLAIDANNDGRITDRTELFGDTEGFADGFAKLSSYDSNSDGKIDANDADFDKLIVWRDVNSDGVSQEGEMYKLAQLGISSINLNATMTDYYINGQWVSHQSTFTMNGETRTIVDAWFEGIDGNTLVDPSDVDSIDGASQSNVISASVLHNDDLSQDDANSVTKVAFNGTTYTVPAGGSVTVTGLYGVLVMNSDGKFTYTANDGVEDGKMDVFTYTLTDSEGDSDTASLTICVQGADDVPLVVDAAGLVDETGLSGGMVSQTGSVNVDYGSDAPGTVAGSGTFNSSGSKLGGGLTHHGVAVTVSYNAATGTYTGMAGSLTVFTMKIEANGAYTFKQFASLDHADGSNPNDIINLEFGVKATDADGDSSTGKITISVKDDAPVANDDTVNVNEGQVASGNILSNDVVGADAEGRVIIINFNGTNTTVPSGGSATINGQYGTLVVNSNGSYTYTAKLNAAGTDAFTYTLKDYDGDTDPAVLSVCVKDVQSPPDAVDDYYKLYELDAKVNEFNPGDTVLVNARNTNNGKNYTIVLENGASIHEDTDSDTGGFWFKLPVLTNDSDPDGDPLTITQIMNIQGLPSNSEIKIAPDGKSVLIRVGQDGNTKDSTIYFDYKITDGNGGYDTARVKIDICDWNSPLVLDLDGDGVELLSHENGVLFDMGPDGMLNKTGWVAPDDGLLALDKNRDGMINDHGELFGTGSVDGFSVLSEYDSNQDGVIDTNDAIWGDLLVWMDKNSDGISQADEMLTLSSFGIKSINLAAQEVADVIEGNLITHESTFTYEDGRTGTIVDAWFETSAYTNEQTVQAGDEFYGMDNAADMFMFQTIGEGVATIHNFDKTEGDRLDLSTLLQEQDVVTDTINEFVYSREENGSTIISVDTDGAAGPGQAQDIARIDGATGLDIQEMLNDGNLIV